MKKIKAVGDLILSCEYAVEANNESEAEMKAECLNDSLPIQEIFIKTVDGTLHKLKIIGDPVFEWADFVAE